MKQHFLLFSLFLSTILFSQEFTEPDSAAIHKSKVKSVKIYYTGTGTTHLLSQEYQYDPNGNLVFAHSGSAGYYYQFTYNNKSEQISSLQYSNTGELISGFFTDYYSNGKRFHVKHTYSQDSIHPATIYTYDTAGNVLEESHYIKGNLTRTYKNEYDENNKNIHRTDSTPGLETYETRNNKTVRQTYYNTDNSLKENCLLFYSDKGRLMRTACTKGKTTDTYSIAYEDNSSDYKVSKNGNKISKEDYVEWDRKFRWLMERPMSEEFGLPYSDPVPTYEYKHELIRDKKGNITKDIIKGAYEYMNFKPVEFDYAYEYW